METKNIKNALNNLIDNDLHVILISGDWGIGKTYTINKSIEELKSIRKKKLRVMYTSLFGKSNIDEINTELYHQLHPRKDNLTKFVSKAINLINIGLNASCHTDWGATISTGNLTAPSKRVKGKKNVINLIILDDFERKSSQIDNSELMGYINNLINQGFKIVILANLEPEKDYFGEHKEKIFDRIYQITSTPEEVIFNIFKENKDYLSENLLKELDNNIRMAIKINVFFNQIKAHIETNKLPTTNLSTIMKLCFYSVIEFMTHKYTNWAQNSPGLKYLEKDFTNSITMYDGSLSFQNSLAKAVYEVYLNEDFTLFDDVIIDKPNILLNSCFYYSDENKIEFIKEQLNEIMSYKNSINGQTKNCIKSVIRDWYSNAAFLDLSFINKKVLFEKLNDLDIDLGLLKTGVQNYDELFTEYKKLRQDSKIDKIINSLNKSTARAIVILEHDYLFFSSHDKSKIEQCLINNHFFLPKINGDITRDTWALTHVICNFVSKYIPELKLKILKELCSIKREHSKDKSCKVRIDGLINQYELDIKTNHNITKK